MENITIFLRELCATNIFRLNSVLEVCLFLYVSFGSSDKLLGFSGAYEKSYYKLSKNSLCRQIYEEVCERQLFPMTARIKVLITDKVGGKVVNLVNTCFL